MVDENFRKAVGDADSRWNNPIQNTLYATSLEIAKNLGDEGINKGLGLLGVYKDVISFAELLLENNEKRKEARNAVDDPAVYFLREDKDENWQRKITFQPKEQKEETIIYVYPPNAYPIIFIPDFMGSNLKDKVSEKKIWNADLRGNLADAWEHVGAYERKEMLAPGFVTVDDRGRLLEEKHTTLKADKMKERGWGSVSYYMYGPFLAWLENQMNDFEDAERGARAKMAQLSTISDEPTEMGDQKTDKIDPEIQKKQESWGYDPRFASILQEHAKETTNIYTLTTDQYKQSYRYRYPVYAFGYNWMLGNIDIVKSLKNFIIDALKKEKDRIGNKGDISKVILVTHGSGGLIARKFAKDNPDLVKGVVFGAMPAKGMPETYKRIKNGSKADFDQAATQALSESANSTAGHFFTETLFPAFTDSSNFTTAAVIGTAAFFVGGPLAAIVAAGGAYAANAATNTVLRSTANSVKELSIASDTLEDNSKIEGKKAEDVAVVAAESIGYLQTLPFGQYPTGAWLFENLPLEKEPTTYYGALQMDAYQMRQATKKPKIGCYPMIDPFSEIYLSSDKKGIYDAQTMNPKNSQGSTLYTQAEYTQANSFKKIVEFQVKTFQTEINLFYPQPCYVFSGILPLSGAVSNIQVSSSVSAKDLLPGDGVVPYVSAKPAHDAAKEEAVFCFEHRKAFFDEAVRLFTVSSITKIATS